MLQDFESAPPPGMKLLTERLKKREEERDKEDPDERGREHAREGRDADGSTARGARPCREHQRQDAEEEAPGRHHHRAEAVSYTHLEIFTHPK